MYISLQSLNQMEDWLKKVEPKALRNNDNLEKWLGVQFWVTKTKLEEIKAKKEDEKNK